MLLYGLLLMRTLVDSLLQQLSLDISNVDAGEEKLATSPYLQESKEVIKVNDLEAGFVMAGLRGVGSCC
jgi:hypothetical protein